MSTFLKLAFLFFIGSVLGWVIELIFRRFFSSKNPERKWINPGFCVGPYLPLYGFGLCTLYILSGLDSVILSDSAWGTVLLIVMMAAAMTLLEYIAGVLVLKITHARLWDYSEQWGNIQGIICPKFTLAWAACAAGYYFLIHPYTLGAIDWLSENLAFSFVIGLFFGVFIIDVVYSSHAIAAIRQYAIDNDVIVKIEALKAQIRHAQDEAREKHHFLFPLKTREHLSEHLKKSKQAVEDKK